ncbi:uncharacterized protein LOC117913971 isoform X3 [Vitis riparia]|uniref:uncharacterized protein LOC117913971 isoform X3 n=1 Tax=Vitis riparia TaxID=96939 RepID=UPI00155AEDF4|nr:uncharacterized protein LOC117913971 isoform X3 [Vitis riparia]
MAQQTTGNASLAATANTHNNESNNNGNSGNNVVICTICIDPVIENGPRAVVRLGCGHQFHLDCIGSEFNARGIMRCPNCRVIEVGEWRFSNGQCTQNRTNENQAQFLVEAPVAVLPWCPIFGLFTHGPYEVWGLPSHGYGPTFSHQLNLLPPPGNAPAQGLPGMLHYGNWGTFSPTSENSSRANPTVPSMMGLSWVASGRVPSLQSVTQPVVLDHGSGAFGPLPSSIGSPVVYTASPPAQPADFYMVPPSGSGLLGQIPRQAVPSPVIHNRMLGLDRRIISQYITNSRDPVWWVAN